MDNRSVLITQMVADCVIWFDESFAIRTNLSVCGRSTWPLLLGRNVQEAAMTCLLGTTMWYCPPEQEKYRKITLYALRWRKKEPIKDESRGK